VARPKSASGRIGLKSSTHIRAATDVVSLLADHCGSGRGPPASGRSTSAVTRPWELQSTLALRAASHEPAGLSVREIRYLRSGPSAQRTGRSLPVSRRHTDAPLDYLAPDDRPRSVVSCLRVFCASTLRDSHRLLRWKETPTCRGAISRPPSSTKPETPCSPLRPSRAATGRRSLRIRRAT